MGRDALAVRSAATGGRLENGRLAMATCRWWRTRSRCRCCRASTVEFYEALGFIVTYRMDRPGRYLAMTFSGFSLHFGGRTDETRPDARDVRWVPRDGRPRGAVEYGGSDELRGLERAIDHARIVREFKNDYRAAARVLDVALRRAGPDESRVVRARGLADRLELAVATADTERARELSDELQSLDLTPEERRAISPQLDAIAVTARWLDKH